MKLLSILKTTFICFFAVLIVGCTSSNNNSNDNNSTNNKSVEMITVKDSIGDVQIPKNPKRIVDLSGNSDILSILGYSVVGTANSDAYDYTKFPSYLEETLKDAKILGYSMQDTVDIEGVLNLNPDLIIISKTQEKMYEQLKSIAPTIMIELEQIDWKKDILKVASILNKEDAANKWLENYESNAKQKGNEIKEKYGNETTYLSILASGGQIFVFDSAGVGGILYEDMGLNKPAKLPVQDTISLPVVSYEGLLEIDSDYIILIGTDEDINALKQSPIYNNLNAVKNNNVIELPSSPYFNMVYSSIGRDLFVNQFVDLMEN